MKCTKCNIVIDREDAYQYLNICQQPHCGGYLCKSCKDKFDENFYVNEPKQIREKNDRKR